MFTCVKIFNEPRISSTKIICEKKITETESTNFISETSLLLKIITARSIELVSAVKFRRMNWMVGESDMLIKI